MNHMEKFPEHDVEFKKKKKANSRTTKTKRKVWVLTKRAIFFFFLR